MVHLKYCIDTRGLPPLQNKEDSFFLLGSILWLGHKLPVGLLVKLNLKARLLAYQELANTVVVVADEITNCIALRC